MINKLHPLTITEKLTETSEFYKTYFDFEDVFISDWYIQLAHKNGAEIALMSPNLPNQPAFLHGVYEGKGMVFTLETDDAKEIFNKLKIKGATFEVELRDEEWGQRHFILEDPSGVFVDIVQYI
ncbi:glyoxalase [Candidatus Saccharibacteria bacterium]|nr:glyoxalase [Candidatus Saccharibacteria bacterium]